ncbi:MAG TPA: tetratricopeptide repeat protein, partial [Chitinophagaceae bacterium]|nr:tetratricopeptide repeat protein [Chitinophagaceae bacterium]
MARTKIIYAAILILIVSTPAFHAQSRSSLEDQGYDYLNMQDFENAYYTFDKLNKKYPKEMDYEFKLGIAALNFGEKKERAIEIFQSIKSKYKTNEAELYLGKAYHRNYKFDEAIIILQPLLEKLEASKKKEDKDMVPEVKLVLKNSLNGKFLIMNKVVADITNIGPPINTHELEGVPVITADESMMIYTYIGKNSLGGKLNAQMKYDPNGSYLSDIYISYKDSATGNWTKPHALEALNTKGNDAAIALSPDGLTLFSFLSNNENEGDILVSQLTGTVFSAPTPL